MSQIRLQLGHLVKASGKGAGLRKRQPRKLRPVRPSRANELWYKAELLKIVRHLRALTKEFVYPELRAQVSALATSDGMARDALPRRSLESALNQVARRMGGLDNTAKRLADLAAAKNLKSVDATLAASIRASVSVDVSGFFTNAGPIREALSTAAQANIDLIKSIPVKHLEKVSEAVEKNFVEGVRWEDLAKAIEEAGDTTESRAKLIARDQTSKMNSAFNEVRQTSLGIDQYTWQTSGDERVREEHAANDGQVFRWDTPPANTGHPGEDVLCRCVAVPFFDLDKLEEEAFQ